MPLTPVHHRRVTVDGIDTFYREAGPADAPVVLLPHGYPCSSYVYRNLMAALGDRWRLVAPDMPGFGYSATPSPDDFGYTFDAYAEFLQTLRRHSAAQPLRHLAARLRLAVRIPARARRARTRGRARHPERRHLRRRLRPQVRLPEEVVGQPRTRARAGASPSTSPSTGFESEFRGELPDDVADRISPDLWTLHWSLMSTPDRVANLIHLLEDQPSTLEWFPKQQAYLREHQPPALIVWGPHDGYMPEKSARAYHRDLPDAPLHLLGGGHWLLETHLGEVVPLVERTFLSHLGESNS